MYHSAFTNPHFHLPVQRPSARTLAMFLLGGMLLGAGSMAGATTHAAPYLCEENLIEIMFAPGSRVRLRGGEPVDLSGSNALSGVCQLLEGSGQVEWFRFCETAEEVIDALTAEGEENIGRSLYNPNNTYRLKVDRGGDIWALCAALETLPGVHLARPVPLPMRPPVPPNYVPSQGYLLPAIATPSGIDANYAWTRSGGNGSGIAICDLEYSWNWLHNDLLGVQELHIYIQDPMNNDNHGTAVLGVLGSHANGWGTTGICHGATLYTCGTFFRPLGQPNYSWNVGGALVDAASSSAMNAGDVLLIEHQWDLTGSNGFVPIEWWTDTFPNQTYNAVYSSIEWVLAVKRMHVVEPAGNGTIDLDGLNWYGDSGAIVVGAGGAYTGGTWSEGNLQRLSFSSYGSRVDLQGWGEDVVTTGYGSLYGAEGVDYYYTGSFDGTSSASAVAAGAVGSCAGFWKANVSPRFPMHPHCARAVLRATGTAQVFPPAGNIGTRPNLLAAFARLDDWLDITTPPLNDTGGFASWGDYDNDGDPDLYLINSPYVPNRLLRNDGNGAFSDVTPDLMKDMNGYGGGAVWGDYDGDGDLDLYLGNSGGSYNKLFRNDSGVFVDATSGILGSPVLGSRPAWVDYDNDGDLDLYVAKYGGADKLLRNDNGTFVDATSGPEGDTGYTVQGSWCDYDNDADLDLYVSTHNAPNKLLRNDNGSFTDVTPALLAVSQGTYCCWGDYDNDGDADLYLSIPAFGVPNKLLRNDGGGVFTDVTAPPVDGALHCSSANWVDANNDGHLDLCLVNNQERNCLFINDGAGGFTEDTHGLLIWEGYTSAVSWGDHDCDGDLDAYFSISFPANSNTMAENRSTGGNNWLQVSLVGTSANRFGIGARVRVATGRDVQIREIRADHLEHSLVAAFGLGSSAVVNSLQIIWPGGAVQESLNVAANQLVTITQTGASDVPGTDRILATRLHPVAPNPLLPGQSAVIRYDLADEASVRLCVFDVTGRMVRVLQDMPDHAPGRHMAAWNRLDVGGHRTPPGVYFCRLEAGGSTESRRLVLLE